MVRGNVEYYKSLSRASIADRTQHKTGIKEKRINQFKKMLLVLEVIFVLEVILYIV